MNAYHSKKVLQYSYLFHKIGLLDHDQFKQIEEYHGIKVMKKDRLK
ncbi:hypothetical protein [Rossellomorea vietnamensis]|uniref:Uncharacterized protein n=1 Tax=Rossellomorea vietnamensis TaxID=218284 RepID=A0ACD4C8H9_9BACI|nr:hypothetical protein [Rossellomorea vietnamensis]UXH44860.1 hypothetical protein N5C46_01975 [Rossellomorea vietnamensis]WQI96218.1 hypothetical protein Q7C14_02085 [Rossellomorea vietnamensis]